MHDSRPLSRRQLLCRGGSALSVLALANSPAFAKMWGATDGERLVPFLDRPPAPPEEVVKKIGRLSTLEWQKLESWITPNDTFFEVGHYDKPDIDASSWRLEIGGLVERPRSYTLAELAARPRQEVVFTLECSGNHGFEWFVGGVGNARWAGTPLAAVLHEAGVRAEGREVVFFGADAGEEEVRGIKMKQHFSRSMSMDAAMDPANLLCWEMNGEALPRMHGAPMRLIAPGWYGIANVKWLTRIEIMDRRWAGRFMAKDYVTIRKESHEDGEARWTQKVVGRSRLKSVTAKVTAREGRYRIYGAAWGAPLARVEVRVDDGAWRPATIDRGGEHENAWKFWHLDWPDPSPGEHTVTSRAIGSDGTVQPSMDAPRIAGKRTYWESNGQITRRVRIA